MDEATTEKLATGPDHHVEGEQKVTQLELFFDLVFVFAFTQVTALMTANPTWEGLGQGLLVLAAVWWAWSAYAFLTDMIASDNGRARLVIFASMAAMLVAALAIPGRSATRRCCSGSPTSPSVPSTSSPSPTPPTTSASAPP